MGLTHCHFLLPVHGRYGMQMVFVGFIANFIEDKVNFLILTESTMMKDKV